jgi:hypothetical protein
MDLVIDALGAIACAAIATALLFYSLGALF